MNFRQNGDKYLITIEVIALIVVLVFGAVHFVMPGNNANKKITESQQETQNPTQETDGTQQVQADGQQAASAFTPSDSVKTKLSSMTTEEKVAQLFIRDLRRLQVYQSSLRPVTRQRQLLVHILLVVLFSDRKISQERLQLQR